MLLRQIDTVIVLGDGIDADASLEASTSHAGGLSIISSTMRYLSS